MLKGQIDSDIEFYGILILTLLTGILISILYGPILAVDWELATSTKKVQATEYANLARYHFQKDLGSAGGNVEYFRLMEIAGKKLSVLGLGENYIMIENILTKESWDFGDKEGRDYHDTYLAISGSTKPVIEEDQVILEKDNEYVIHVYSLDSKGTTAVDIYSKAYCDNDVTKPDPLGKFRIMGCGELSGLIKTEVDDNYLQDKIIKPVKNRADDSEVVWVVPESDMTAEQIAEKRDWLFFEGSQLGTYEECASAGKGSLCFRLMGDFVLPAKMQVRINDDTPIVVQKTSLSEPEGG